MNKLPFLATKLVRRSVATNSFCFNRKFSSPVDSKSQGNVIDLLSRKGSEGVESRFKFGGSNVKLENLSEFSEEEKLLPQLEENEDDSHIDNDNDEDLYDPAEGEDPEPLDEKTFYYTDKEYLQKLEDKGELTWPVQRSYILKSVNREMEYLENERNKEAQMPPLQDFDDSETDLEIADDPLTRYYGSNIQDNVEQALEQTETLYLDLLNKTVDRILVLQKKEAAKREAVGKVLAKKKEARKNKPKKAKEASITPPRYILGVDNHFEYILNKLPKTHAHYGQAQSFLQAIATNPAIDFKNKVKISQRFVDVLLTSPEKDTPEYLDSHSYTV